MHIQKHRSCLCVIFIVFNKSSFESSLWYCSGLNSSYSSVPQRNTTSKVYTLYLIENIYLLAHDSTSWEVQSKPRLNVLWCGRHYMMRQSKHDKESSLWHAVFKSTEWCMRRISCGDSITNWRSNFQNHKLTRKQSYTLAKNNFPVVSALSQCLPWCFFSSLYSKQNLLHLLASRNTFLPQMSHLWECGTNYIFHTVPQLFPTNYHQIYWETFIPKQQRHFKIAKWN